MATFALVDFYSKQPINGRAFVTAPNRRAAWKMFYDKWHTVKGFPREPEIAENIEISKWDIIEVPPPASHRRPREIQTDFTDRLGMPTLEQVMKYTLYCDMDGVLTNWDLAVEQLGYGTPEQLQMVSRSNLWKTVARCGEEFWSNMPWKQDGKQLWEYIRKFDPIILSSPARNPVCYTGKRKWCEQNLGLTDNRVILRNDKEALATPNAILIDDTPKKLDAWKAKGGIAILHTDTANTIKQLQELIQ